MENIKLTWPTWSSIVVQLQRRDRQSDRMRPCYAVVAAPAGELTATEPTVVTLPRVTRPDVNKFCLNKRCTEAQCQWWPEVQRDTACDAAARDGSCEIDAEDKRNLLDVMLGDLADETAAADSAEADGVDDEQASSQLVKRDAIVDLWPYGHTPAYYIEVLTLLGVAMKASGAIIVSTTAHPGHWMACLAMGLESWVLTRRWSEHSAAHGLALGRDLLLKDRLVDMPEPVPAEAEAPLCQCLQAALKQGAQEQVLEAYDLTQGTEWNEGINR
ncbi:MAG: hypothetical protein GY772_31675, partial [bacterium]|nr:hypothetical protein [bacterium]